MLSLCFLRVEGVKAECFNPPEEKSTVCVGYSLSQRVAQEHTQILPSLLLQKQRVSRTRTVTFPGQQSSGFAKSSAEPGLAATAASVGSTGEGTACLGGGQRDSGGTPRDTTGTVPSPRLEQDLALRCGCHLGCAAF